MLELRVLGPLEVVRDGEPVPLPRQMHRALLALLVLHRNEIVSTDSLIEELWSGQPPATAKDALQNYVSQLRKALGRDVIATQAPGYVLDIEAHQTDAGQFEQLVAEARAAEDPGTRAATLRTALALWRGPALADLAYESFAASAAARLEDVRAAAQEDLVDAELALGHHADLVPQLEELVDAHPYDERARAQLMLALYRSGRQADALGAFQETRQRLADELGLDPSPALRELERAILLQEPSLVSPDGDAPATAERRKTVTVLSAALSPSEELDPEPQRAALVRGVAAARAAVEHHEGWVTARADEELMGVFGVPESHEDDALRAVRAATELRQAIAAEDELELRVGIDAGEALTGHGLVSGDVTANGGATPTLGQARGRSSSAGPPSTSWGMPWRGAAAASGFAWSRSRSMRLLSPSRSRRHSSVARSSTPWWSSSSVRGASAAVASFCWSASRASARAAWRVSCTASRTGRNRARRAVWAYGEALRIYPCGRFLPRSTSTRRSGTSGGQRRARTASERVR